MPTLTTVPAYPIPGKKLKYTLSDLNVATNYVKLWVTDAPPDSGLKKQLESTGAVRLPLDGGEGDSGRTFEFTPDKGGVYVLLLQEYTKGASPYGGGYKGSPGGHRSETKLAETTLSLYVGTRLTSKIGTSTDSGTLVFYVFNETVRATAIDPHGEVTPAIISANTPKAKAAVRASAISAAVTALAGQTASTLVGTPSTIVDGLLDKYNAHLANATVHNVADTENTVSAMYLDPTGVNGVVDSLNQLADCFNRHISNDDATRTGPGTGTSHDRGDWENKIQLTANSSDVLSRIVAIAEMWRAYEAHRVNTTVHNSADATNAAAALPALIDLHRLFLAEVRKGSPTAPSTSNPGATLLVHSGGMTE